jgi:NAD(P)H-dependent FMN reductase
MSISRSIAVIVGSTRTPRVGSNVAAWVKETIEKKADTANLSLSLVEIADFKLPVYDETVIPAYVPEKASFSHEHSKKWSAEIAKYDAYVFVAPECKSSEIIHQL